MKQTIFKSIFFCAGLALILLFSAFLISKNSKDPKINGPKITFTEEKHDFGEVKVGPALETIFEFTNTGANKLVVTNVQPSCGCTGAILEEKKEYEPGEKGKIKVTFNTE